MPPAPFLSVSSPYIHEIAKLLARVSPMRSRWQFWLRDFVQIQNTDHGSRVLRYRSTGLLPFRPAKSATIDSARLSLVGRRLHLLKTSAVKVANSPSPRECDIPCCNHWLTSHPLTEGSASEPVTFGLDLDRSYHLPFLACQLVRRGQLAALQPFRNATPIPRALKKTQSDPAVGDRPVMGLDSRFESRRRVYYDMI